MRSPSAARKPDNVPSSLCLSQRSSSAASAARKSYFSPRTKNLVWLDSCDEHRNEERRSCGLYPPSGSKTQS
ncbi:hypothetical protein CN068_21650 [Sinorhizobium meliloti]|nr:hypothetical protein C3L21_04720 [Sinorhizobium meliloti]RMI21518.1 hypothetical protein DA102_002965 [Sinorhizobium meliloti]RVH31980.1 hypothetical protein CN215_02045 [Sinorhizobium meliloti]RVH88799.1 hypothetical protein CN199_29200 [Sinorhizobium meliloti]RVK05945.1 hypothetical protein CN164_27765 [Sinorhizobium meliloti]